MKHARIINRRAKDGWTKGPNRQKDTCDICGDRLWVPPDDETIYCNGNWDACLPKKPTANGAKRRAPKR